MRFEDVKNGYANLFTRMTVSEAQLRVAENVVDGIIKGEDQYRQIEAMTGVPWWWIGITHHMESNCDFSTHLHNGDPLTARTVKKPAGRPANGEPPFSWITSAIDALDLKGLRDVRDWTISRALYEWERYNGFGNFARGVNSAYIWSFSSLAQRGKFIADGVWDASVMSEQVGTAPLLLVMLRRGYCTPPLLMTDPPAADQRPEAMPTMLTREEPATTPLIMTVIDWVLGGTRLQGYKTLIGVAGYTLLSVGQSIGALPMLGLSEGISSALLAVFAGLAGLGVASKIERARAS